MAVICVAGVTEGIGKTAVAEMLIQALDRTSVARIRLGDEVPEAEAANVAECGHLVLADKELADNAEAARYREAGAESVTMLLAEPRGLSKGLVALDAARDSDATLLVEGNAWLWAREADLVVMVIGPGPRGSGLARVRGSARDLFEKVGIWAWNTRSDPTAEGFFEFPQRLARLGFRDAVYNTADFHHVHPGDADHPGNAAFMKDVRERLDGPWWRRESDAFLRRLGFDETRGG